MNDYTIDEKTLNNGYTVKTYHDTDPESPREWDSAGTVALVNRCRYGFGDEALTPDELRDITNSPDHIVLPIYIYDHSGVTINTTGFSCGWDSGQVGIIYISKADAVREWGKIKCTKAVREKARQCLRAEVETLDQYLTGSVYGYRVFDPQGEEVDSCWGFFGDSEVALNEGIAVAESYKDLFTA